MRLKSINYSEGDGTPQQWQLDKLSFGSRMLVVGRNAAGKSRTLALTAGLAKCLSGVQALPQSGNYSVIFDLDGREYHYELQFEGAEVKREIITIDGEDFLDRADGGAGTIFAEQIGQNIKFQVPPNIVAAVARRDTIQHSFIEPLFEWGNSLRFYQFGSIQKGALAIFIEQGPPVNDRDQNAVVAIFAEGVKLFGEQFVESIKADMTAVDYQIERIELARPISLRFIPGGPEPVAISVKETDLQGVTDQIVMSEGMFRVLAILIHVNFARFKGSASSVFIDDVGEGLDFDRSCRLIDLLRYKSREYDFQLVMSTNDKFVMNQVPLDEWTILNRTGNAVHVRNHENSSREFDEFKFTGLSNFSFFEMNAVEMSQEMPHSNDSDA